MTAQPYTPDTALDPRIHHWWSGLTAAAHGARAADHHPHPIYPRRYSFLERSATAREMDHL